MHKRAEPEKPLKPIERGKKTMTGLFDRLVSGAEERIANSDLLCLFWMMLEGDLGVDRDFIVSDLGLTGAEVTDLDAVIASVNAELVGGATREALFHKYSQVTTCLERGKMTEAQARTKLGI